MSATEGEGEWDKDSSEYDRVDEWWWWKQKFMKVHCYTKYTLKTDAHGNRIISLSECIMKIMNIKLSIVLKMT